MCEFGPAPSGADKALDNLGRVPLAVKHVAQHVEIAENRLQEVVELVRDAAP
jgi:hypothetical protein